jgi:hypothetical protein
MQDNQLQVALKEIYKLAELIMTIPSSTATVEQPLGYEEEQKRRKGYVA